MLRTRQAKRKKEFTLKFLKTSLTRKKVTIALRKRKIKLLTMRKSQKLAFRKGQFRITDITGVSLRGEIIKQIIKPTIHAVFDVAVEEMDHDVDDIEILFITREEEEERRREDPDLYRLDAWDREVLKKTSMDEHNYKSPINCIYEYDYDVLQPVANFEEFFEIDFDHVPLWKVDIYGDFAFYGSDPYIKETKEYPEEYISDEKRSEVELDYLLYNSTKLEQHRQYIIKNKEHFTDVKPQILETGERAEHLLMKRFYYNKIDNVIERKQEIEEEPIYTYIKFDFGAKLDLRIARLYYLNFTRMERMDLENQQKLYEFEKAALKGIAFDNFMILFGVFLIWATHPYLYKKIPWRIRYFFEFHRDEVIEYILMIPQIPKITWEEIKAYWTGQVMFTVIPTFQYAWSFLGKKIDLETIQAWKILAKTLNDIY
uniref:Mp05-like protein n=1 Tax=Dictyostelium citrinum TaxID=361072 RepID=B2VQ21_DICCI|nr:Mp05-like protein [Dictyostelium citrinum]ACD12732.1 Mp05-like protein [Dictyostelium citrinum]